MIHLDGVSKRFGATVALHPTSLTFASGETTVLIGPSGCGKSTVLRLVNGLISPDTGTVRIGEAVLTDANQRALRHRMGYVIQEGGLFPHLTARDNVTLLARHLGWGRKRIAARVAELAVLVHLPLAALDRYPSQLSGGQRQRVGLMRALLLDPDVLLFDEPLGALDPLTRADVQDDLRDVMRTLRKTALLVTHDLAEAAFFADRIVLLREGTVVQTGTVDDFTHRPAAPFVTDFLHAQRKLIL